jgi:hypothetical protein
MDKKIVFCKKSLYTRGRGATLLFQKGKFYFTFYYGFHFMSVVSEDQGRVIEFNRNFKPPIVPFKFLSKLKMEDYFEDIEVIPLAELLKL